MAKRAVGNLLGLAVLSVLAQRPMHRYEIATTIREQGKDRDMAVKWGSLYTVVGALERRGFVEATGIERDGSRPERTTYRITGAGRREMADWTRELVSSLDAEQSRFATGLAMLGALQPDEATLLLHDRLDRLDARIAERRDDLARGAGQVPRLFLVEDEYGLAVLRAEADWLRSLLTELESGSFPGLDDWRDYHRAASDPEGAPTPTEQ
jgi:DNA-binding PadR family transcriptional regulator